MRTSSLAVLLAALGAVVDVGCAVEVNGYHLQRRTSALSETDARSSSAASSAAASQKDQNREKLRSTHAASFKRLKGQQEKQMSKRQREVARREKDLKRVDTDDTYGVYGPETVRLTREGLEWSREKVDRAAKEHQDASQAKLGQHSDEMRNFEATGNLAFKRQSPKGKAKSVVNGMFGKRQA